MTDWPTAVIPHASQCPVCKGRTFQGRCPAEDDAEHLAYEAAHAF